MISWEDYIGASKAGAQSVRCRAMCGASFAPVRDILTRIIAALAPRSVACLGAGVLNDIPFRDLVRAGVDLHLVDWIPGVIETGIEQSIIERDAAGRPECAFCPLGEPRARAFCHRFDGARDGTGVVGEEAVEFVDRFQVAFRVGEQTSPCAGDRAVFSNARQ